MPQCPSTRYEVHSILQLGHRPRISMGGGGETCISKGRHGCYFSHLIHAEVSIFPLYGVDQEALT